MNATYNYSGDEGSKAPLLEGLGESYVLPDLFICQAGQSYWLESKAKAKADYTRITKRLEHGFELRLYGDYVAVQRESGIQVVVCVYEENTRKFLFAPLRRLGSDYRVYDGKKVKEPMIYFPRSTFKPYHSTALSRISLT